MMNEIEFNISASKRPLRFQYKIISENCFKFEPLAVQIKRKQFCGDVLWYVCALSD